MFNANKVVILMKSLLIAMNINRFHVIWLGIIVLCESNLELQILIHLTACQNINQRIIHLMIGYLPLNL